MNLSSNKLCEKCRLFEEQNNNVITMSSPSGDKIELFKSLFRGRVDICAKRWRNKPGYSPYCFNDFESGICAKPKVKCTECKNSDFPPFDEERIKNHLLGKYVAIKIIYQYTQSVLARGMDVICGFSLRRKSRHFWPENLERRY